MQRVQDHLRVLDQTLSEWKWLAHINTRPLLLTDCLLWEELDVVNQTFGNHLTFDETETLARFYNECPGRPVFDAMLKEQPCQITGRPGEADAITRIQRLLA